MRPTLRFSHEHVVFYSRARLHLKMADEDYESGREHVTTYVQSPDGMIEVGSFNAKRNFLIDEHLLVDMPERAEPGVKLGSVSLVGAGPGDPDLCEAQTSTCRGGQFA